MFIIEILRFPASTEAKYVLSIPIFKANFSWLRPICCRSSRMRLPKSTVIIETHLLLHNYRSTRDIKQRLISNKKKKHRKSCAFSRFQLNYWSLIIPRPSSVGNTHALCDCFSLLDSSDCCSTGVGWSGGRSIRRRPCTSGSSFARTYSPDRDRQAARRSLPYAQRHTMQYRKRNAPRLPFRSYAFSCSVSAAYGYRGTSQYAAVVVCGDALHVFVIVLNLPVFFEKRKAVADTAFIVQVPASRSIMVTSHGTSSAFLIRRNPISKLQKGNRHSRSFPTNYADIFSGR